MTTQKRETIPVSLECGHLLHFGATHMPKPGEELWCPKCDNMTTVKTALTEYQAKCTRCSYSRSFGNAPVTAETRAVGHSVRKGHPVQIFKGGKLVKIVGNKGAQLTLDDLDRPLF